MDRRDLLAGTCATAVLLGWLRTKSERDGTIVAPTMTFEQCAAKYAG